MTTRSGIVSEYNLTYSDPECLPSSRLHTLDIHHLPQDKQSTTSKYWIVYIHGGAWRDPAIDSRSITAVLPHLLPAASRVASIVSLNYRLSPYPRHQSDPSGDDESRQAVHPDHVMDVLIALCWLQRTYSIGEKYIIVGHSAGATLAFQAVSKRWEARKSLAKRQSDFAPPMAIAGVAGIYDLKTLVNSFSTIPIYREIVDNAFGKDEELWNEASPANLDLREWDNAKVAVLADSEEDGLIDIAQSDKMWQNLKKYGLPNRKDFRLKLHGQHDEIWSKGMELAKVIIHTLDMLSISANKP